MPVGRALDKDLVKFFGTVFPSEIGTVDLTQVSNYNGAVGGGKAQYFLPKEVVLTTEKIADINSCAKKVVCYEGGLLDFDLTDVLDESLVIPNCEANNIDTQLTQIARRQYIKAWNSSILSTYRSALESNAVEYEDVSGDDIRTDIQNMILALQTATGVDSANIVVKLSGKAYNQALAPSSTANIMAFNEEQLRNHLGVGYIWKDIQATVDIEVYIKDYALIGASCVTEPTIQVASDPEYYGDVFVAGKMKWGVELVTPATDYSEFMKVTTYGGVVAPATRKATK